MSHHVEDPRFAQLRVCREHGRLYDPAPHFETGEQQLCHGRDAQPKWDRYDFNEWVHLCESCLQDTTPSGSRFSTFFCETCRILVREKAPAVPIGRHSLLSGSALPPNVDAAARRIRDISAAIDALHGWSHSRLLSVVGEGSGDPELAGVVAAARRRWDKEQAVADLVKYWKPERR